MISANQVRATLNRHFKDDAELLKDFGEIAGFGAAVASAAAGSPAGIVALILKTAGSVASAADRVMRRIGVYETEQKSPSRVSAYDRFQILFYVACQRAFLEAVTASLPLYARDDSAGPIADAVLHALSQQVTSLQEAEVRFVFTVDPTASNIPLYDLYGEWMDRLLTSAGITHAKSDDAIRSIKQEATRRLHVWLSSGDPHAQWISNYLAIARQAEATDDLRALRETLQGWRTAADATNLRRKEWASYSRMLEELPDRSDTMYDEDFGVRKVFVTPQLAYFRVGSATSVETIADAWRLLGALLSDRVTRSELIVLSGGPGSGKSTLCRMLASELARDEAIHPVYLRLRRAHEGEEPAEFVQTQLKKLGLIETISDLAAVPNVVLILDGFDELVLASRVRLRHFFSVLMDEISTGAFRNARVVLAGRDTLFPKGEGLPRNAHVVTVLPFDRSRVAQWGLAWRQVHGAGPGATFHPEVLVREEPGHSSEHMPALEQLATWPLTLHLLARVHTAGLLDVRTAAAAQVEKAYLYRGILYDAIRRQAAKSEGAGRLAPEQLREFLRLIAWEMYTRSVETLESRDVLPIVRRYYPNVDEPALVDLADVAVVSAPAVQHAEDKGIEFVHKTFFEFLVAEYIARTIDEITHRVTGPDDTETWYRDEDKAAEATASVFGIRVVPAEVQQMFEPMLGSFSLFARGRRVDETLPRDVRAAGLQRVRERFDDLYRMLVAKRPDVGLYEKNRDQPLARGVFEFFANYACGIVLIGSAAARRQLSDGGPPVSRFVLNPVDGAFWKWIFILHAGGIQFDADLTSRLFSGSRIGLGKAGDWSLPLKLQSLTRLPDYRADLQILIEDVMTALHHIVAVALSMYAASRRAFLETKEQYSVRNDDVLINGFSDSVEKTLHDVFGEMKRIVGFAGYADLHASAVDSSQRPRAYAEALSLRGAELEKLIDFLDDAFGRSRADDRWEVLLGFQTPSWRR